MDRFQAILAGLVIPSFLVVGDVPLCIDCLSRPRVDLTTEGHGPITALCRSY